MLGDLSIASTEDPPVVRDDEASGAGSALVNSEDG
jgi:hypothetical protein